MPHGAPRVCGDDPFVLAVEKAPFEVLPAYAGMIPPLAGDAYMTTYVLPAYAGMIPPAVQSRLTFGRAPRVCGDDPVVAPVERAATGVLPAYAGMIPVMPLESSRMSVCSPRMRG